MSITLDEDTPTQITLDGIDPGAGEPLSYTVDTPPAHGTLSGTGPHLLFTPNPNYNGEDKFTYLDNDSTFDSNIATVTLTVVSVNDPPVAQDLTLTAFRNRDSLLTLPASDVEGDPITYGIVTPPQSGSLSAVTGNRVTYTPPSGFTGLDPFTFKANDGQADSNTATVALNVIPPLLLLGSQSQVSVAPGETITVPIATTAAAQNVAGLEITLQVTAPEGVPPLVPSFARTSTTANWLMETDLQDPWHITIAHSSALQGENPLLLLTLESSPDAPLGTVYQISAKQATFTDEAAAETDVTEQTAPLWVSVLPCETRQKGDANGDGSVNVADAVYALRTVVGLLSPPNECARVAADVNCDGSIKVGDAVLILRHVVIGTEFPVCPPGP